MKEQKFEERFNYLLREVEKKMNIDDTNSYNSNDQMRIDNTINFLENKKSEKCKLEIEQLKKHSSNFYKLDNLENSYAEKGHQKEFEESKIKLEQCLKPMNTINNNFKDNINFYDNIIQGSFDICLKSIKDEIKNGKINENISRAKIETCYNYFIRNKTATSKILGNIIDSVIQKY